MSNLAVSDMPLKWCKRNCYNTCGLSEKLVSFTICVSFFIGYMYSIWVIGSSALRICLRYKQCRIYKFCSLRDSAKPSLVHSWLVLFPYFPEINCMHFLISRKFVFVKFVLWKQSFVWKINHLYSIVSLELPLFYNEWEHNQFSPLYNDITVLCKLNNTDVTI